MCIQVDVGANASSLRRAGHKGTAGPPRSLRRPSYRSDQWRSPCRPFAKTLPRSDGFTSGMVRRSCNRCLRCLLCPHGINQTPSQDDCRGRKQVVLSKPLQAMAVALPLEELGKDADPMMCASIRTFLKWRNWPSLPYRASIRQVWGQWEENSIT